MLAGRVAVVRSVVERVASPGPEGGQRPRVVRFVELEGQASATEIGDRWRHRDFETNARHAPEEERRLAQFQSGACSGVPVVFTGAFAAFAAFTGGLSTSSRIVAATDRFVVSAASGSEGQGQDTGRQNGAEEPESHAESLRSNGGAHEEKSLHRSAGLASPSRMIRSRGAGEKPVDPLRAWFSVKKSSQKKKKKKKSLEAGRHGAKRGAALATPGAWPELRCPARTPFRSVVVARCSGSVSPSWLRASFSRCSAR